MNSRINIQLSREETTLMRGMAITAIFLHNFCHWLPGVIEENESDFTAVAPVEFLQRMMSPTRDFVFDIFSFLGWYGVPVFIFLTGYGLVKKYEETPKYENVGKGKFLFDNWKKLLLLLLPAVAFMLALNILVGIKQGVFNWDGILHNLSLLTFLNDPLYNWIAPRPGVYWYFGVTLEFYIIYIWLVKSRPAWWLIVLTVLTLIAQIVIVPSEATPSTSGALAWMRNNFVGWTLSFAFGIFYARRMAIGRRTGWVIMLLSFLVFFPAMFNEVTWQLTPLCAIVMTIALAKVSMRIAGWRQMWIWLGGMSAYIFVVHPLVREQIYHPLKLFIKMDSLLPLQLHPARCLIIYVLFVLLSAVLYRVVHGELVRLCDRSSRHAR